MVLEEDSEGDGVHVVQEEEEEDADPLEDEMEDVINKEGMDAIRRVLHVTHAEGQDTCLRCALAPFQDAEEDTAREEDVPAAGVGDDLQQMRAW